MQINERILEINFYIYCRELLTTSKKISDLHNLFEALAFTDLYKPDILVTITTDFFVNRKNLPTVTECAIIHDYFPRAVPFQLISRYINISYSQFAEEQEETRKERLSINSIRAKYATEVHQAIRGFKTAVTNLSKWKGFKYVQ